MKLGRSTVNLLNLFALPNRWEVSPKSLSLPNTSSLKPQHIPIALHHRVLGKDQPIHVGVVHRIFIVSILLLWSPKWWGRMGGRYTQRKLLRLGFKFLLSLLGNEVLWDIPTLPLEKTAVVVPNSYIVTYSCRNSKVTGCIELWISQKFFNVTKCNPLVIEQKTQKILVLWFSNAAWSILF